MALKKVRIPALEEKKKFKINMFPQEVVPFLASGGLLLDEPRGNFYIRSLVGRHLPPASLISSCSQGEREGQREGRGGKGGKVGKGETWTRDSSASLPHRSHSQLRSEVCLVILPQFLNLVLPTLLTWSVTFCLGKVGQQCENALLGPLSTDTRGSREDCKTI